LSLLFQLSGVIPSDDLAGSESTATELIKPMLVADATCFAAGGGKLANPAVRSLAAATGFNAAESISGTVKRW
jgi:hypothetical protein